MSASTSSTATSEHPSLRGRGAGGEAPLRERAFALHCQGLRSPAIAKQLGVPQRTVRAWLRAALDDRALEARDERERQLQLAIARQETILAAAWDAYSRVAAVETFALEQAEAAKSQHERQRQEQPTRLNARAAYENRFRTPSPPPGRPDYDPLWDADPAPIASPAPAPAAAPLPPPIPRLPVTGARYLALAMSAQREIARLQGLDHYTPPEPAMLVVRCLEDYQLYETLPEPERSAWLLFLAHYLEQVYPDLIDSDLRPQEAAAAQRELADAIAQARFAEGEDDDEDSDDDPDAEDSMYGGSKPASDIPAESATASVDNAAESAIEDDPDSYANPLPYSVAAGFPAPAPEALAIAERRMAEADALDAAQPDGPRDYPPGARDKLSPSVTEHPHPERVLRSLIHRLRSGTLPLPSPAPAFEPVNIQLDDEPGIRGIPDVLNEQES